MGLGAAIGIASIGASLIGSKKASDSARQANDTNAQISADNLALQQEQLEQQLQFTREENDIQRAIAQMLLDIQLQGTTGPSGETVSFQEGKGFVTELPPVLQAILEASQANQLQQQAVQAPRAQQEQSRAAGRRGQIGGIAESLIGQLQDPGVSAQTIEGLLQTSRSGAVNSAFDDSLGDVITQSLRTGGQPSQLVGELAKQRAQALTETTGSLPLEALRESRGINAAQRGDLLNALASAQSLAAPTGLVAPGAPPIVAALSNQAAGGGSRAAQAANLFRGTLGFPNITPQNTFRSQVDPNAGKFETSIGNALAGLFKQFGGSGGGGSSFGSNVDFGGSGVAADPFAAPPSNIKFLGNQI